MSLINDIINKHVSDRKGVHVFISRQQIAAICRDYAFSLEGKQKPEVKPKSSELEKKYKEGWMDGYKFRSNEIYDEEIIGKYHEYFAKPEADQD